MIGFSAQRPVSRFRAPDAGNLGARACNPAKPGPFAQAIAGIDLAVWDLHARRQQHCAVEAARRSTAARSRSMPAASIRQGPSRGARQPSTRGHRALKLKIGFRSGGRPRQSGGAARLVGEGLLAADVNQGWSIEQALELAPQLAGVRPWLAGGADPRRPAVAGVAAVAPGNQLFRSRRARTSQAMPDLPRCWVSRVLGVVQPDIAKWGGLSACAGIARDILQSGKMFCPHYLGAGIGLLASAHLLAGVGGDGLLEVDANENPLRDRFCGPVLMSATVRSNSATRRVFGSTPDLASIEPYRTA